MDHDYLTRNKQEDAALAETLHALIKKKPWVAWAVSGVVAGLLVVLCIALS